MIGKRIKDRRIELGLSVEELADKLGKNRATIYRYENEDIKNLSITILEPLAHALETTPAALMGYDDIIPHKDLIPITPQKLPLFDGKAAGEPRLFPDGTEVYVDITTNLKADYALKVHGDSMIGARINDGDIVFIRKQTSVENGEIAAVLIDDSATLKRVFFYREHALLVLRAENPNYKDMTYSGSELENIKILGKAVAFQSDVK